MLRFQVIAVAFMCVGLLSTTETCANRIVNGSFEQGDFPGGDWTVVLAGGAALTGWTVGGEGVDWHKAVASYGPAQSGIFMVDLNRNGGGSGSGTLSQSFTTVVGADYALNFYLAGPSLYFPNPRQVKVDVAGLTQVFSQAASPENQLV